MGSQNSHPRLERTAEAWLDLDKEQELVPLSRTETKQKFLLKEEDRPRTSCDPVVIVEQEPNRLTIEH